uniref:Uncharacterized protein n=1 Tax=Caulobacter phage BL57 TaxID=3348355 RepID=A0AB74UGL7_9VIRU
MIGEEVRAPNGETGKIKGFYGDVKGGLFLDRNADGFQSWNVAELEALA